MSEWLQPSRQVPSQRKNCNGNAVPSLRAIQRGLNRSRVIPLTLLLNANAASKFDILWLDRRKLGRGRFETGLKYSFDQVSSERNAAVFV